MQKRNEKEWAALASEYQASGQGQTEWCKTKGINLYTFRDRLSRLRKSVKSTDSADKQIASKTAKETNATKTRQPIIWLNANEIAEKAQEEIKIGIGKFEIRINGFINEATLSQVCILLSKIC